VRRALQGVPGQLAATPDPHLTDAELAVDVQLLDAPGGPDHLDGQIGSQRLPGGAENVALIRLHGSSDRFILQRPRSESVEFDIPLQAPRFDQAADPLPDPLMTLSGAHDLQQPLEVGDARSRVLPALLQELLILRPGDAAADDEAVFVPAVVTAGRESVRGHGINIPHALLKYPRSN